MDYNSFHRDVISMQHRINDWLDDTSHEQARELVNLFQKLEDDVQVQKNAGSIRDQLKRIEAMLQILEEKVMSNRHIDELVDWVRDSLRKVR